MTRRRSRDAETEDVVPRRLKRGGVQRTHVAPWAIGGDELAPGVVGDVHLHPTTIERIREVSSGSGAGQTLILTATGVSIESGGDYVIFDTILYQAGFDGVTAAGDSIPWPLAAHGAAFVEFVWDSYEGGGTVELETDGAVPAWGVVGAGGAGREGRGAIPTDVNEGAIVKLKITQTSGVAQIADVTLRLQVQDPSVSVSALTYAAVVLADGPIAYWRLGESSGTTAADATDNGHDGTYVGATLGTPGAIANDADTAISLTPGAADEVTGLDWADLEFAGTEPFTIEAWAKWVGATSTDHLFIYSKVSGAFDLYGLAGQEDASGNVRWKCRRADGVDEVATLYSYNAGAWYHVVATYDGSTITIYVNGSAVTSGAASTSQTASTGVVKVGANTSTGFPGDLDEVAVYGRALTATEIEEHYFIGVGGA